MIGCLFMLPFAAGVGVYLLLSSPSSTTGGDTASQQSGTSAPPDTADGTSSPPSVPSYMQTRQPKPGTAGFLDFNGNPVLVATTEGVASQIANDINADNVAALRQLEKDGDSYFVEAGTTVVLIKSDRYLTGTYVLCVSIEDGSHKGEIGWVPGEYMR